MLSSWLRGELQSAIVVFTLGARAIYGYGASRAEGPGVPKSHGLHFLAMQQARARGCRRYDLGGFSDGAGNHADASPTQKVNFFKRGFGGHTVSFGPAWERARRPLRYAAVRAARRLLARVDQLRVSSAR